MWQTAHDMCSLSAYHAAFTDCKEGDVYDPSKPTSTSTILINPKSQFITTLSRYCLAAYWSDELGYRFFGAIDEGMHFIWRTTGWRGRS